MRATYTPVVFLCALAAAVHSACGLGAGGMGVETAPSDDVLVTTEALDAIADLLNGHAAGAAVSHEGAGDTEDDSNGSADSNEEEDGEEDNENDDDDNDDDDDDDDEDNDDEGDSDDVEAFLADHKETAKAMWGNKKPATATVTATKAAKGKKTVHRKTTRKTTRTTRTRRTTKHSSGPKLDKGQQARFKQAMQRVAEEHKKAARVHMKEMEKFGQMMTSMGAMTSPIMALGDNTQFNNVLDSFDTQQVPGNINSKKGPPESAIDQMGQEAGSKALLGMMPMMMNKDNDDPSPLLMAISGF